MTVVGYMGNNALPARAGDILKSVLSSRQAGTPTADGFGSLVAERVLDAVALVLVFAVLVTTLRLPLGVEGWMLAAVGGGPRPRGRGRRLPRARHRRRAPVAGARDAPAGPDAAPVVGDRRRPARALVVLWLIEGSVYAVLGAVAGVHLSLLDGLYIMALANLVALVPAAPGYLGTFDAAVLLGVRLVAGGTHAAALAYAVVVRFVLFVPITLVGLVALVVRYGGLRRMSVALRRPAPRPCRPASSLAPRAPRSHGVDVSPVPSGCRVAKAIARGCPPIRVGVARRPAWRRDAHD